jgi:hypothetical protein
MEQKEFLIKRLHCAIPSWLFIALRDSNHLNEEFDNWIACVLYERLKAEGFDFESGSAKAPKEGIRP